MNKIFRRFHRAILDANNYTITLYTWSDSTSNFARIDFRKFFYDLYLDIMYKILWKLFDGNKNLLQYMFQQYVYHKNFQCGDKLLQLQFPNIPFEYISYLNFAM